MSIYVIARRTIVYQQPGSAEATVLFVPSRDQVQVIRDAAGTARVAMAANANAAKGWNGPQMSRVVTGQRYMYGYVLREIFELRQTVKVWLPEDLVPPDADAFFFVFSPKVIVHGSRERSDEGQMIWRSAQLSIPEDETLGALRQAIGDYTLANPQANVCITVSNQLDLYKKLKDQLQVYSLSPVPFSKLKPRAGLKPLYGHYNLTWLYMLVMAVGFGALVASAVYLFSNIASAKRTSEEIEKINNDIARITINPRTGYINQPEQILSAIDKPLNVSLSSVIDAAGRAAMAYGNVENIAIFTGDIVNDGREMMVKMRTKQPPEPMLIAQEIQGKSMLENRPWVRSIERLGQVGETLELQMGIYIQGGEGLAAPDVAPVTTEHEEMLVPETDVHTPTVSETANMAVQNADNTVSTSVVSTTAVTPSAVPVAEKEVRS